MAETSSSSDRSRRLREADSEELLELVREEGEQLDVAGARQVLLNPFVTREVIEELLAERRLLAAYEVRHAIAVHPRTPEAVAMRFLPGLFWPDLLKAGGDTRLKPVVRRAADRYLVQRLAGAAVGEKIAVARRCGPGVLQHLRLDPSPRVMAALLENPRLTEAILLPVASSEAAAPAVLRLIAGSRWGLRYDVRRGLSRNPRTPPETALSILPHLSKEDLRAVAAEPRLAAPVRRRARLLLGDPESR